MDQYIGKLLDNRYEILERIGTGGMAVVYKARCHRLNRLVAVKILKSDLAQDAEFRRRFHDESQAVAMLSHPNIVAVYDVSRSAELDYIVMELIDGITLKQYMQKKGEPLNWREALHFITQIMKALSHAHSRGIIHRDIKPHNIMILRDGSVKVADFGIARLDSAAQNTLTQEALGSVHYISPEQARGSHIDARSDIYSAGVVLYEMLTGRLPYEGDSPISVAIQHINSIPLSPRELNPEIPEALEAITMKAMASNMEQRYLSADAMLADLEEFRKNPSINFEYTMEDLKNGGDEPTQVMETTGSHAVRAAAAAAGEGAGRSGGGRPKSAAPAEARERRRREREELDDDYDDYDDRRRGSPVPVILAVCAILIFLVGIGYFLWVSFIGPILNPVVDTAPTPNLIGMQFNDAKDNEALLVGGFTVVLDKQMPSEDVPEGEIMDQTPKADEEVSTGNREIKVTVSSGSPADFKMGNYVNSRAAEIKALLEIKGIEVQIEEEASDVVTKDYIISQRPVEGTKMEPGDAATLVVSTGREDKEVTLIDFTGMTPEAVKTLIEGPDWNLLLGSVNEVFSEAPVGTVVRQSPGVGTSVKEKTIVNLEVSKGPDPAASASPEPTPTESEPAPTPTPEPTPAPPPPDVVNKRIDVSLPDDRDTVTVRITVAGTEVLNESYDTVFHTIHAPIYGIGAQQEVCVYIDGVLTDTQYIDFVK